MRILAILFSLAALQTMGPQEWAKQEVARVSEMSREECVSYARDFKKPYFADLKTGRFLEAMHDAYADLCSEPPPVEVEQ